MIQNHEYFWQLLFYNALFLPPATVIVRWLFLKLMRHIVEEQRFEAFPNYEATVRSGLVML